MVKRKKLKQWSLEQYNKEYFLKQMLINDIYIATFDNENVGAMIICKKDIIFWEDDAQALYVHKLMTKVGTKGIGEKLLEYAQKLCRKDNKQYLRLDCKSSNEKLNEYYNKLGFMLKGNGNIGEYNYNLLEKSINN